MPDIGVPESRILFLNLLSAPEGIAAFKEEFPELRIVTAFVDEGLDARKYALRHSRTRLTIDLWSQDVETSEIDILEQMIRGESSDQLETK